MKVYAVVVQVKTSTMVGQKKVSQECYRSLDDAIQFIEHRADKPMRDHLALAWKSSTHVYEIVDLDVV